MNEYKPAIKQGVRMGIISIVVFLIIYAIDPMFFAKPAGWIVLLVVNILALPIVFQILGARNTKLTLSPFTFGKAFNSAFFTGIVAALIVFVFNAIFLTIIDPQWEAELTEEVLNSTQTMMENMGAPEESIDEAMEQAREKSDKQAKGIVGALRSTGGMLVWYALIALIVAAVYKEKVQDDIIE